MTINLPDKGQWIQRNRGDTIGNVQGTFNIDWTKILGKTRVTRMLQTTLQAADTDMTSYPVGFQVFNDGTSTKIWTVAGSKVHSSASPIANSNFSVDQTSGTPTDCDSTLSDIIVFGLTTPLLCVTANNKLYVRSTGSWTSTSFTGGGPWMMAIFAGRLYFTVAGLSQIYSTIDGSTIISPSGTPNVNAYSFSLDSNQRPTFIRAASNKLWVGTISTNGGKGYVYEFANGATQYTTNYRLESGGALSCVIKDDIPQITDANGRIFQFNNGTFDEIGRLPLDDKLLKNALSVVNNRFIHPNGMTVINGKINLLINNILDDSTGSIPEFCPSGIWEYDDIIYDPYTGTSVGSGLYHKYSFSYSTQANSITDYGQNRVSGVGALSDMKLSNSLVTATGNLLAGATIYTDASTTTNGTFTNDTFTATSGTTGQYNTQGAGYIVTTKIPASQIAESWQRVEMFYRQFLNPTDIIIGKYRLTDVPSSEITLTWVTGKTFTTTTNVLALIGYEVEIIQGTGSGRVAHITKVDVTSGVYTVTLDDTITGVSGTAKARLQAWIKMGFIQDQVSQYKPLSFKTVKASSWVQLKLFFIFVGIGEFNKAILISQPQQLAK